MTSFQKTVKYIAVAFALFLIVSIFSGILGAFGFLGGFAVNSDDPVGEMKTYTVSNNIDELEIDISAAQLVINNGDEFKVASNNKYLKVTEEGNCLVISETDRVISKSSNKILVEITVPEDKVLKSSKITTGAGKVSVKTLSSEKLYFELGAGQVEIENLIATHSSKIVGGTGQINIKNGTLKNLDLEMGVGELRFSGALKGSCDMDMGVGAAHINLLGKLDDYRIELEKGLGEARIDDKSYSDNSTVGSGENTVEIEGGVGGIYIDFEKITTENPETTAALNDSSTQELIA